MVLKHYTIQTKSCMINTIFFNKTYKRRGMLAINKSRSRRANGFFAKAQRYIDICLHNLVNVIIRNRLEQEGSAF